MKKSIKTIALLCLGMPLLMANSPAPIAHEEEYQKSIGYPRLAEHSKIHKEIVHSMSELITKTKNII